MHDALIDALYENESVEGIALFNDSGELLENQLALNEASVIQICACITQLKFGLAGALRIMQGFVLQTNEYTILTVVNNDMLILLQVTKGHSLNNVHEKVRSQLGIMDSSAGKPRLNLPTRNMDATQQQMVKTTTQQPAAAQQPATAQQPSNLTSWSSFHKTLTSLLKPIAPKAIANKMVDSAAAELGIEKSDSDIPIETALSIGATVVNSIPNASRRKLIQKEYDLIIKQYR